MYIINNGKVEVRCTIFYVTVIKGALSWAAHARVCLLSSPRKILAAIMDLRVSHIHSPEFLLCPPWPSPVTPFWICRFNLKKVNLTLFKFSQDASACASRDSFPLNRLGRTKPVWFALLSMTIYHLCFNSLARVDSNNWLVLCLET